MRLFAAVASQISVELGHSLQSPLVVEDRDRLKLDLDRTAIPVASQQRQQRSLARFDGFEHWSFVGGHRTLVQVTIAQQIACPTLTKHLFGRAAQQTFDAS